MAIKKIVRQSKVTVPVGFEENEDADLNEIFAEQEDEENNSATEEEWEDEGNDDTDEQNIEKDDAQIDEEEQDYEDSESNSDDQYVDRIVVQSRLVDLVTGKHYYRIEGKKLDGTDDSMVVAASEMLSSKFSRILMDHGWFAPVSLNKKELNQFFSILQWQCASLKDTLYTYNFLGYAPDEKGSIRYFPNNNSQKYEYRGNYDVQPHGSYDAWVEMYQNNVKGHKNLELAVCIALTAPLVFRINQFQPVGNLLVTFYGESSTGKTTALQLALSTAGKPVRGNHGIMDTMNGTTNAIMQSISKKNGFLNGYDEATGTLLSPKKAGEIWNNLIYNLHSGEEKNRLNSASQLCKRSCCYSTSIFTAEKSVIATLDNAIEGQAVRLLEVEGGFTESSAQSNAIKKACLANYGWILPRFIENIEQISDEQLEKKYEKVKTELDEQINIDSRYKSRIIEALAMVMLTAKLINRTSMLGKPMKFRINVNMLLESLKTLATAATPNEINAEDIINHIIYSLLRNKAFEEGYNGKIGTVRVMADGTTECFIEQKVFKSWLNEACGGIKSDRSLMNLLISAGYLKKPGDKTRLLFKRKIGIIKVSGYVIILDTSDVEKVVKTLKHRNEKEEKLILEEELAKDEASDMVEIGEDDNFEEDEE